MLIGIALLYSKRELLCGEFTLRSGGYFGTREKDWKESFESLGGPALLIEMRKKRFEGRIETKECPRMVLPS